MGGWRRLWAARPQGRLYYGWVLVVTLGGTTIISYGTTQYLFGVLVEPLGRDLGWSRASITGAYALGVVLAGVLGLPVGRLVDRHGARLVMAVGSALAGFTLLGLAQVQTLWQWYVLMAGGLGTAAALTLYPVTFTVMTNWFVRKRGAALALLTLLGGLASPVFLPLAGALVASLGWRNTLLILGLVQLVVALPLHALLVRRRPEDLGLWPDGAPLPPQKQAVKIEGLTLHTAFARVSFWTLTGAIALAMLAANIIQVHQVAYLVEHGMTGVAAASVAGFVGLASLPGRFLLNRLSDRLGPQILLGLCLVFQAVGVLMLLQGAGFGWLLAYVLVYGAAFGAVSPLRAGVMAEHFGRRAYGAITAAQGLPVALAAGLGPLAAGWLHDRLGQYELSFWISLVAFLLASLFVLLTPRPRRENQEGGAFRPDTSNRHFEVHTYCHDEKGTPSMPYDVLVIGAGQAGLAAGYTLGRTGLTFALLEAGTDPVGSWPLYYDSLTLFSPARFSSLPGLPFPGHPERYPHRDEVIAYLRQYTHTFQLPIIPQTRVERVEQVDGLFQVHAATGAHYEAKALIAATGAFHHPFLPQFPGQERFQGQLLHAATYRQPEPFRGQHVIVVGAGNSAVQIAVELAQVAQVSLASRTPINFRPQVISGRDRHFWAWLTGLDRLPIGWWWEQHAATSVLDTGRYQQAFTDGKLERRPLFRQFTPDGVIWADGREEPVDTVLFATGFRPNLDYLSPLGALDAEGRARQRAGMSLTTPGLYYLGVSFQRTFASATLRGVGADAASVMRHLRQYLGASAGASTVKNPAAIGAVGVEEPQLVK